MEIGPETYFCGFGGVVRLKADTLRLLFNCTCEKCTQQIIVQFIREQFNRIFF